jgi:hypothetical protein
MCIDLDIAVEGVSRSDVANKLEAAVLSYIHAAQEENGRDARRLLSRRAPFGVRLAVQFGAFLHLAFGSRSGGDLRGGFEMACPG